MKQPTFYTKRLKIREITPTDVEGMFALDSNPNVHEYLGNKPVKSIDESAKVIEFIRQQYVDNGIGRWAVEEIETGNFIGWTGFKKNTEVINGRKGVVDIGYRFIESAWGKGYASESALACMWYGFNMLKFESLQGMADVKNDASNKILKNVGLKYVNTFDFDGDPHYFYEISKTDWIALNLMK